MPTFFFYRHSDLKRRAFAVDGAALLRCSACQDCSATLVVASAAPARALRANEIRLRSRHCDHVRQWQGPLNMKSVSQVRCSTPGQSYGFIAPDAGGPDIFVHKRCAMSSAAHQELSLSRKPREPLVLVGTFAEMSRGGSAIQRSHHVLSRVPPPRRVALKEGERVEFELQPDRSPKPPVTICWQRQRRSCEEPGKDGRPVAVDVVAAALDFCPGTLMPCMWRLTSTRVQSQCLREIRRACVSFSYICLCICWLGVSAAHVVTPEVIPP